VPEFFSGNMLATGKGHDDSLFFEQSIMITIYPGAVELKSGYPSCKGGNYER